MKLNAILILTFSMIKLKIGLYRRSLNYYIGNLRRRFFLFFGITKSQI